MHLQVKDRLACGDTQYKQSEQNVVTGRLQMKAYRWSLKKKINFENVHNQMSVEVSEYMALRMQLGRELNSHANDAGFNS